MKGIILAGGKGTRMYPLTRVINKHLLPIYDKPLIYYPLSTLMIAGIRDIMIICRSEDILLYKELLGNGHRFGINICYETQDKPSGIPEAFLIAENFIDGNHCCLVLGDNIFFGHGLRELLKNAHDKKTGGTIFAYWVKDPKEFAVVEIGEDGVALSIEEKPKNPKTNFAVPGLYFYDEQVIKISKSLKPSARGELEITDVNLSYLNKRQLKVSRLNRSFAWFDAGSPESMLASSQYLEIIERKQGLKISCPEEIAWNEKWIDESTLDESISIHSKSSYGEYLKSLKSL